MQEIGRRGDAEKSPPKDKVRLSFDMSKGKSKVDNDKKAVTFGGDGGEEKSPGKHKGKTGVDISLRKSAAKDGDSFSSDEEAIKV